ncbi:hypothetical protein CRV24_003843 [Beauveria bassiana]|uniref:Uncharacterized protein n=1 Tax=Beauveria bassiana (strain ARSEF 2860) TaxID=655819 RepID=J4W282_BEAB2|nr:uncharacterized protein BBA_06574 [Beauveria bassiana ARSEF 2860]EJP64580.1 hypothetical protein BBA_06574 [Beauveria bassiana ARSEF 2860]KAF1734925.1 hypothetical protein CRV24_003843 [Beauveria bassiana]KAH8710440.1 hypothetical protein HC256_007279 [Beauveria bassiana]
MKTTAAVFAVAASASAPTLTGPFSFVDPPMSTDALSIPNTATPSSTQTPNIDPTSDLTPVPFLPWDDEGPFRFITIVRKDASASDLGPPAAPAAAATTNQMTTIASAWDVSVAPTVEARGEPDMTEEATTTTMTQSKPTQMTPNPAGTMRADEILDALREHTKSQEQQQAEMTTTQSIDLVVPMTTQGNLATDAVATTTGDAESRPTIEHVEEFTRECGF